MKRKANHWYRYLEERLCILQEVFFNDSAIWLWPTIRTPLQRRNIEPFYGYSISAEQGCPCLIGRNNDLLSVGYQIILWILCCGIVLGQAATEEDILTSSSNWNFFYYEKQLKLLHCFWCLVSIQKDLWHSCLWRPVLGACSSQHLSSGLHD